MQVNLGKYDSAHLHFGHFLVNLRFCALVNVLGRLNRQCAHCRGDAIHDVHVLMTLNTRCAHVRKIQYMMYMLGTQYTMCTLGDSIHAVHVLPRLNT